MTMGFAVDSERGGLAVPLWSFGPPDRDALPELPAATLPSIEPRPPINLEEET
jgi:hypothetical protein